jgi:hypothetical protein
MGYAVKLDWHSWPAGKGPGLREAHRPCSIGGGSVAESKNKGDGMWCPSCRALGKYSWLSDYRLDSCPGIKISWHKKDGS